VAKTAMSVSPVQAKVCGDKKSLFERNSVKGNAG
jgi:hypothetical protein